MEGLSIVYLLQYLILLGSILLIAPIGIVAVSSEEHFRIPGYPAAVNIFLRHRAPAKAVLAKDSRSVLFIHGATFPSASAAAYKFDNHSWMDDLSTKNTSDAGG